MPNGVHSVIKAKMDFINKWKLFLIIYLLIIKIIYINCFRLWDPTVCIKCRKILKYMNTYL